LIYSNSFEDIAAISVAVITSPESFESGSVKKEGLFDLRLGPWENAKAVDGVFVIVRVILVISSSNIRKWY
jgi:hypothetical protein